MAPTTRVQLIYYNHNMIYLHIMNHMNNIMRIPDDPI